MSGSAAQPLARIVAVEDDPGFASLVVAALDDMPGRAAVEHVATLQAALDLLRDGDAASVLCDLTLPDAEGVEVVQRLRAAAPLASLVVLTGRNDDRLAVEALRRGADDYVVKSHDTLRDLQRVVRHSLERSEHRRSVQREFLRAEAVFDALGNAVILMDAHARVQRVNQAARGLLGDAICDVLLPGEPLPVLTSSHPAVAAIQPTSARVLETKQAAYDPDVHLPGPDGELWVDVHGRPVFDDRGRFDGIVLSLRDVSFRRTLIEAHSFQSALLEAVGQAVTVTGTDGRITFWNPAAERLYGWAAEDAVGRPMTQVVVVRSGPSLPDARSEYDEPDGHWVGDLTLQRKDGSTFEGLVTDAPMRDADGRVIGRVTVSTDITERKRAERAAQELSAIVASSADAILTKALDGTIQTWNAGAEALYGYSAQEAIGRHVGMLDPRGLAEARQILEAIAAGETIRSETVRRRKDGTDLVVELTVSPMLDVAGVVVGASAIARDISDRRRLEKALNDQALYDTLTGLPNRRLLQDRLEQMLGSATRRGKPLAVLFCDLDHFKRINDSRGHLVGDQLLTEAADRLRATVRGSDTVARFGGDEFVILAADADDAEAEDLAQRVAVALQEPMTLDGRRHVMTASIGIAVTPPLPADPDELLRHADAAMYGAKAAGRATFRVFNEEMASRTTERLQLTDDLRAALESDALELRYQPQIDLETGHLVGLEALLRWQHPERGWVSPEVFVALADEGGFGVELDDWVLAQACADTSRLLRMELLPDAARVAVNCSVRSLTHELVARVRAAARRSRLPLSRLELEVTETGLMTDLEQATRTLSALRAEGVGVALDDFGTGYSSLVYVRDLPITTVKIDRSFVQEIADQPDSLAIATSIIDLGRRLGLRTIGEGVETPQQLSILRRLRCDVGQGFLWAPALPLADLVDTLKGGDGWAVDAAVDPPLARARQAAPVTNEHGLHRLLELHSMGASLMTISAALNTEGYRTPTGARWHHRAVARAIAEAIPRQRRGSLR